MKTFPIVTKNYTSEIRSFYCDAALPVFEWGKKIYVLLDNELTAMIPLCAAAMREPVPADSSSVGEYYTLIGCKIAGRPKVNALKQKGNFYQLQNRSRMDGIRFFESPEDYYRYLAGDVNAELRFDGIRLRDILSIDFGYQLSCDSHYKMPVQWAFSESSSKPVKTNAPIKAIWIDEEGSHCELCSEKMSNGKIVRIYPTEEECRKDNMAKVVDFDDDEPAQEAQQWIVNLPKTVAVTAKTAEEAEQIVKDAINNIVK